MRKYKQCIQVGDNVIDIMKLPCVIGVMKDFLNDKVFRLRYLLSGDVGNSNVPYGGMNVSYKGDWLMLDVCDNWCCMSNEEYERHNEDEI